MVLRETEGRHINIQKAVTGSIYCLTKPNCNRTIHLLEMGGGSCRLQGCFLAASEVQDGRVVAHIIYYDVHVI